MRRGCEAEQMMMLQPMAGFDATASTEPSSHGMRPNYMRTCPLHEPEQRGVLFTVHRTPQFVLAAKLAPLMGDWACLP